MALPVDIYVRVSRVGGREHLISPDEQEQRGRALARERGLEVGAVLVDLDESGGKLDRPGLQEALRRVEGRQSRGIVVAWLDRLTRDSEHAIGLARRISEAGGVIYAPDAPADWTTPEGELQAGIVFTFAQYVRSRARAGFERAKERSIANGIPIHTRAPVGYRKCADRRLEPDPVVAPIVRDIFERRARGESAGTLGLLLEAAGVRTSQGATVWTRQAVAGVLRNRVYLGELHYGRDRSPLRARPFVNVGAHEPSVVLGTFELAQSPTRRDRPRGEGGSPFLLTGLLRCHGCGYAAQATYDAHGHRIYRCGRRHAGGVCPAPARNRAEPLEAAATADFWQHTPNLRARGRRAAGANVEQLRAEVAKAGRLLEQWLAPAMQEALVELPEQYAAGTEERRRRVHTARAALEEAERLGHGVAVGETTLREAWKTMSVGDRRSMLLLRYDCLVLRRQPRELVAFPRGSAPSGLPRRGYRRDPALVPFGDDIPAGARLLAL